MASIRELTSEHIRLFEFLPPKERGKPRVNLTKTLNGVLHVLRTHRRRTLARSVGADSAGSSGQGCLG